jgi:phosphoribosylformimino-5-aminoimidazole carboxamide ribotide isomerase
MRLIPVVDLLAGTVVHARKGARDHYRPLQSLLCPGSTPSAVIDGLLSLHDFGQIYIADLDAIQGRRPQRDLVRGLAAARPGCGFLVDGGVRDADDAELWLGAGPFDIVVGSENLANAAAWHSVRAAIPADRLVLSLDFQGDAFQGPPDLLEQTAAWPERLIVMTLARVGSDDGPDWQRLATVRRAAAGRQIYAAGGVRGVGDLRRLAAAGIDGVLVASALHDGRLGRADIDAVLSET